jgi:hypothetical protein|tara:strand:- start:5894 stop:8845 length:2952 start_codon:yes stop_codon:yes gene_type:complete
VASKQDINNQKELNENLKESISLEEEMADGLRSYTDMMKDVNRLTGKKITLDTEVQSQLNKLTSSTTKLYQQQEGMTRLTDKQLDKEAEKARIAIAEVKILAQSISKKTNLSNLESELLATMDDKFQRENGILEQVEEQVLQRKEANKAMGVAGGLLKGLTDLSPQFAKALKIDEVAKDMQTFADQTAEAGGKVSKLQTLAVGAKSAFENLFSTLTDPTVVIGALVKGFLSVDKAQTAFKRQTGQTVDMIDTMNSELLLSSEYIAASTELTKELGMNASAVFSKEDITEVALMTKQIGLSTKEANSLAMQSKIHGMSVEDNNKAVFDGVNAMNKQNGSAINGRKVLDDVANVSEEIAISYAGYPGELAAAATAAASLGMNLSQVDKIAGSLLNFESSIQAEMEAELLTGKSLNLEKARQLALDNDLAGVANELANQGITMASFGRMNRLQQEAQAKAVGMTRQELAKSLMLKEMEAGLDRESLDAAGKQQYDELKSLEVQEQFNTAIGKLQEALAPIVGFFASILSKSIILYPLIAAIGTVMAVKMAKSAASFASSIGSSVKSSMTLLKNLGSSGSIMGKMYKGGQFMPGGGRAAAGGQRAGGLMGKIKGAFSAPKGLDKGAKSIAGSADKTKGIDPKQGLGIKKFLQGLGDGLASIGQQAGKVILGGVALGIALAAMGGGLAAAMLMIAGSDPVLMLAFAGSLSAIGLTIALMGKVGTDIIKGALAMGIMAIALIPAAYAFSLLAGVDASSILAFSIAIPILGLSVMALGLIFTNPITMFLFGAGILGLVSLGAAIIPLATAFSLLKDVDIPTIGAGLMSLANPGLIEGLLAFGDAVSSLAFPLLIGSVAFTILGPALQSTSIGFEMLAASNMMGTVDSLQILSTLAPGLLSTSGALFALAGGLAAVGVAGLLAIPAMAAMSLFGVIGGEESGGGSSKEDGGMAKINANLEKLIALVEAGGDVFIDGAKVGKTLQLSSSTMG